MGDNFDRRFGISFKVGDLSFIFLIFTPVCPILLLRPPIVLSYVFLLYPVDTII